MCLLKVALIFRNILLCKPPLNLFFSIVWLWPSCYYPSFKIIFSPRFFTSSGYSTCSQLFCFLYLLILVKEKMNKSVTVHFPDYAFNENIHNMYFFDKWDVFLRHLFFMRDKKIKKHVSFAS